MCDLICDVITCCVWSCNMGKINVYDKIMIKNQEKDKIWKSEKFYINLHLIDSLADARGSADIIYRMWRMSLLCRSGIVIDVKK